MDAIHGHPFVLDEIDDASAALILELQREDVEQLQRSFKGKNREDDVSDIDLAVQLFQQDLEQTSAVLTDRCMSRSLARAVIADSAFLTDAMAQEDTAANDKLLAERLHHGNDVECSNEASSEDINLDDLLIARLTALYVSGPSDECVSPVVDGEESTTTTWFNGSSKRPLSFNRAIGPTVHDLHALPSSHPPILPVIERLAPFASTRLARSARAIVMMEIVPKIRQHSRCLQQQRSRDGNGVIIADDWLNWI
ncbi:MAG: hypothetical protein Q9178_007938 [Gyalolechia marmorata]